MALLAACLTWGVFLSTFLGSLIWELGCHPFRCDLPFNNELFLYLGFLSSVRTHSCD
jgi:hypothetical protein